MVYYNYDYTFYSSFDHFTKHVLGALLGDKRPRSIIAKESEHWQNYKGITTEQDYYEAACENIEVAKRITEYRRNDNSVSINYQKENVQYDRSMTPDQFEGLLTTCVIDRNSISSCFYKTLVNRNIELVSILVSMYSRYSTSRLRICTTSTSLYIDGFSLKPFPNDFRQSFNNFYEDCLVPPKYGYLIGLKLLINKLLFKYLCDSRENLIDKENEYVVINELSKNFIEAFDKKGTANVTSDQKKALINIFYDKGIDVELLTAIFTIDASDYQTIWSY